MKTKEIIGLILIASILWFPLLIFGIICIIDFIQKIKNKEIDRDELVFYSLACVWGALIMTGMWLLIF